MSGITFITRYYPPSPNINGESVCDLVEYLEKEKGIRCNVITTDRMFGGGGGGKRKPAGNVIRVKAFIRNEASVFRFISFLIEGLLLTLKALKFRNDLIVVTTSPPLLPMWASLLFGKKIRWCLWTLDLFPEAFAATGKISEKNILYQLAWRATYRDAPNHLICLGPRQANHVAKLYQKDIPTMILPCGVFFFHERSEEQPAWYDEQKIILGYCGNLHDAHNPEFIKAVIDNIQPEKHLLILALYGSKAPAVKEYAQGKPGVILVENVPRNQLHFIDIHLVSLTAHWTHIVVPSKAITAVNIGSTILFCGDQDSDNWQMLRDAGWFINEREELGNQVAIFLHTVTRSDIQQRKQAAKAISHTLRQYITDTYSDIAQLSQSAD